MEEMELQERPGFFSRIKGYFVREDEFYEEEGQETATPTNPTTTYRVHTRSQYGITVRRNVASFQDAVMAADGLKRGEQQIMNLTSCDETLREKIKDFMSGVNYSQEGTWEELGTNVYLLAPVHANVEVAPASPRMAAARN